MNFKVAPLEVDDFPIERAPSSYDEEGKSVKIWRPAGLARHVTIDNDKKARPEDRGNAGIVNPRNG